MSIPVKKFTRKQMEIAIEVLSQSQFVLNWCKSEARTYGLKHGTPEYEQFVAEQSKQYARRILR